MTAKGQRPVSKLVYFRSRLLNFINWSANQKPCIIYYVAKANKIYQKNNSYPHKQKNDTFSRQYHPYLNHWTIVKVDMWTIVKFIHKPE